MQNKTQIPRHFKVKFYLLAELGPTRPDTPFPANFRTRPDPRVGSRVVQLWVRGHSWSLKLVPFETLGAVSYSPSIETVAVSVAVCEIFSVK